MVIQWVILSVWMVNKMVKKGDRIKVTHLAGGDDPSISVGDKGVVEHIHNSDFTGRQIFVQFDNGASLMLLEEDGFKVLESESNEK